MRASASLPAFRPVKDGLPSTGDISPDSNSGGWTTPAASVEGRRLPREISPKRCHEYQRQFVDAYEALARKRNLDKLEKLFVMSDEDNSGELSVEEFQQALRKAPTQAMFSTLGLQPHQAIMAFHAFDANGDGLLSREEFIQGLMRLCEPGVDGCCPGEINVEMLQAKNFWKRQRPDIEQVARGHLPDLKLVSQKQVHRAFVGSALSKALHPAFAAASHGPASRGSVYRRG